MNRITWLCLSVPLLLAVGCATNDGSISGVRADGLVVNCEPTGDDVYACDPEEPADEAPADPADPADPENPADPEDPAEGPECQEWEDGGAIYVLWPPNHTYYTFTLDDCAAIQDECDVAVDAAAEGRITAVTSDEADNGRGDGNTEGDINLLDDFTVELRSERQGGGDGRVYRIEYETDDGDTGACEIHVPHDQGPFGGAEDSGEAARVEAAPAS